MPYPAELDDLRTDGTPEQTLAQLLGGHAEHHNDTADAVNRIQAELGLAPAGPRSTTVALRLDAIDGGIFNVKQSTYGAVGDGVTLDTAACLAATAAAAAVNGVVYYPPGTYLIRADATSDSAIEVSSASGFSVTGAGMYLSTLKVQSTNDDTVVLALIDCDQVEVSMLGFDGNCSAATGYNAAVEARGCSDISITSSYFTRTGNNAIRVSEHGVGGTDAIPDGADQSSRILITGNQFVDNYGNNVVGTKSGGATDITVTANTFVNFGAVAISIEAEDVIDGTTDDPAEFVVITGNQIQGGTYARSSGNVCWGISLGEMAQDVAVTGNQIRGLAGNTGAAGVLVSSSPSQEDVASQKVTITGNVVTGISSVSGRDSGVALTTGDVNLDHLAISGNTIEDVGYGVMLLPDSSTATLGTIRYLAMGSNVIEADHYGVFLNTSDGATLAIETATITGNVITGPPGTDGILLRMENGTVVGNTLDGFARGIVIQATNSDNVSVGLNSFANISGNDVEMNGVRNNVQLGDLGEIRRQAPREIGGTGPTALLADVGRTSRCTNASAVTLTVPANTFSVGDVLWYRVLGAGGFTATPAANVTISTGCPTTAAQGETFILECIDDTTNANVFDSMVA